MDRKRLIFLALAALLSFSSCATRFSARLPEGRIPAETVFRRPGSREGAVKGTPAAPRGGKLGADEERVLASARGLLGRPPDSRVQVNGRNFTLDCIGTVSAIYYGVQIDVTRDFPQLRGNGVGRLHESLRRRKAIYFDNYPRPGDIVFWDNTWDANGDGNKSNDPLTHAGVVLQVDADGTIHYVHAHHLRGVVVEVMNLREPDKHKNRKGKVINSPLAMGSGVTRRNNPSHWLSGDLWNSFGDILRVKDYYAVAAGPGASPVPAILVGPAGLAKPGVSGSVGPKPVLSGAVFPGPGSPAGIPARGDSPIKEKKAGL